LPALRPRPGGRRGKAGVMSAWEDAELASALAAAFWLLVPAGVANMAPVVAAWLLPSWDRPVDFGCSLGGERLFGDHKTWRGVAAGIAAGAAAFAVLQRALGSAPELGGILAELESRQLSPLFGAWIGCGALTGDLVKSYFKRRSGIPPGRSWFPFDQIDWLLGALVFAIPVVQLSVMSILATLVAGVALHLVVHALGRAMGLNQTWI